MAKPELSVVIVSYNARSYLERCLADLWAGAVDLPIEVIVVDNGSTDGSLDYLQQLGSAITLLANSSNTGFAGANNQGIARAQAPFLLLLNSDAFISSQALLSGLETLRQRPDVGLVGVRLVNADGTLQAASGDFPSLWDDIRVSIGLDQVWRRSGVAPFDSGPVDWIQGACMFVRVSAARAVGPLDERFFMYSEEVDWCRRFWGGGWKVWYRGDVEVVHVGGGSSENDLRRRQALYRGRLGFRRRVSGSAAAMLLWVCMVLGLGFRIPLRAAALLVTRRPIGRQTPRADWQLLRSIAGMDPLARWAAG